MAPQKCFARSPVLNALKYLDKLIGLLYFYIILINRGWLNPNILQRAFKIVSIFEKRPIMPICQYPYADHV